ncbi:MAG: hypothetical protein KAS39_01325 [Actinomycetia bacterium]|nr:hypothetical protein [Actinomycetes bacterium]
MPKAKTKKPVKKPAKKKVTKEAKSITPGGSGEKTISIREIANGWVINESWQTPGGQYKSKETFTKEKPVFKIG